MPLVDSSRHAQHKARFLTLRDISLAYGGLEILRGVSLEVPEGGVVGLIGPNGAGKTTLFNVITRLAEPDKGEVLFRGQPLAGLPPHRVTEAGLARTFQNLRIFRDMSLVENVMVGMHDHLSYSPIAAAFFTPAFRRQERLARERAREILSWVGLQHQADEKAHGLSYGEQRKLEIARALATNPKMILLDEPVAGMNTGETEVLMETLCNINRRGHTLLLIEHDMRFVMGLCREIIVLNFGQVIARGTPESVRANPTVVEAYLGTQA